MDAFVGEIRAVGFNFAPQGWLSCDGSVVNIASYTALFQLVGTTYGGDGQNTFGLPDLRGRVAAGASGPLPLGSKPGQESVTLTSQQVASHNHPLNAANSGNLAIPSSNAVLAATAPADPAVSGNGYLPPAGQTTGAMAANSIGATGGSQSHENRQPLQVLNYIICTQGNYPPPPT